MFTGRVHVGGWGRSERRVRRLGRYRLDGPAVLVGEGEAGRCGGVAADAEQALVVEAVVERAQRAQVVAGRAAAVLPVRHVVDVQPPPLLTAGHPAAAVAVL